MHTEIVRCLRIRHASLFDQPHRLKLELACKLPPFHDSPPVPSKHLTLCLRNQVQAKTRKRELENVANSITEEVLEYWTTNPELRVEINISQRTVPAQNPPG